MSNVAEKFDLKSHLVQWLGALGSFYIKDLRALPEDQLSKSPGGVAKTPQKITAEVIGLCKFATLALRGETSSYTAETDGEPDLSGCDTADKLAAAYDACAKALSEAIQNAPDDIWMQEVMPPWQMKDTVFGITNIAINHIWYHDGQINSYQALLGDDKVHWMD